MIFKAKAKRQTWPGYDQTDVYEQFRPAWFHFSSGPSEQPRAANVFHSQQAEEVVVDILHPPKRKSSESRVYTASPKPTARSISYTRDQSFLALCKRLWIDEELFFAMNKLSLLGLVVGLMFLGTLFFLSGFLMAVNLYGIGVSKTEAQLAAAHSLNSSQHMPTPGYIQGQIQSPAGFQANRDINAPVHPHYASIGGVAMVPTPRLPSNIQQRGHVTASPSIPTRGMASVQQYQARTYPQPLTQPATYPSYQGNIVPQGTVVYAYPPAFVPPSAYPAGYATVPSPAVMPTSVPYGRY